MRPASRHPKPSIWGSREIFQIVYATHWIATSLSFALSLRQNGVVQFAYLTVACAALAIAIGLTWWRVRTSEICKHVYLAISIMAALPTAIAFFVAIWSLPQFLEGDDGGTPASVVNLGGAIFPAAATIFCVLFTVSFASILLVVVFSAQTGLGMAP